MSARHASPTFNPQWEEKYFVVFESGKARCSICGTVILYTSHYNIERHFTNVHAEDYGEEKLYGVAR